MNADRLSQSPTISVSIPTPEADHRLERAVEYIVDECFFTVGQVVGTRKTIEFDAVVWLRDHFRAKFLNAMHRFGNRWMQDRQSVMGVAFMLAERATRYAGDASAIDVEAARQAAADVERYCTVHAMRAARNQSNSDAALPMIAGYWCTEVPDY